MDMKASRTVYGAVAQIDYLCCKHGHPGTWSVLPGRVLRASLGHGKIVLDCMFDTMQDGVVEVRDERGVPFFEFEVRCEPGQVRRLCWKES